jgi:membrane protein
MAPSIARGLAQRVPHAIHIGLDRTQEPRKIVEAAAGRFFDNNDLLWASALTYTTALSIVPLLVLAFSVLKGLGYTNLLQPMIAHYSAVTPEVADRLMAMVDSIKVTALGSAGAVGLIITDISVLGTIESAFNNSWGVAQGRSYLRKFTDYLSVTFTVPVLLVAALTLTAGVAKSAAFLKGLSFVASFVLVWAGYLFLYVFFPNTRVRWKPALIGSLVTALLWTLAQWAYVFFQYGVSSYRAYYGALAAIPIFLVWIYFSWAIVLFGVELTVVLQRGPYRPMRDALAPGFARRAALLTLIRIGERMARGGEPATPAAIAHELGVSEEQMAPIIDRLKRAGILADAQSQHGSNAAHELLLTRSPRLVQVSDALEAVEKQEHPVEGRVEGVLGAITRGERESLGATSVLELISGNEAAPAHSNNSR